MIFCVEDDNGIRDLMIYTLNASGFKAMGFADGNALFNALTSVKPRLIMLDIMLPGMDGIEILKRLRQQHSSSDIPIILATAKGTEYDRVIGLDLGADDYLSKPFGMMEMVSRIKAVLRRTEGYTKNKTLYIGNICLNPIEHTVLVDNKRIILTLKEFEMLHLFMEQPGKVFTRDELLSQIWGTNFLGETRTVDVHIGTLRTKLGAYAEYIETVRGVGYRMEANK